MFALVYKLKMHEFGQWVKMFIPQGFLWIFSIWSTHKSRENSHTMHREKSENNMRKRTHCLKMQNMTRWNFRKKNSHSSLDTRLSSEQYLQLPYGSFPYDLLTCKSSYMTTERDQNRRNVYYLSKHNVIRRFQGW